VKRIFSIYFQVFFTVTGNSAELMQQTAIDRHEAAKREA